MTGKMIKPMKPHCFPGLPGNKGEMFVGLMGRSITSGGKSHNASILKATLLIDA